MALLKNKIDSFTQTTKLQSLEAELREKSYIHWGTQKWLKRMMLWQAKALSLEFQLDLP